MINFKILLFLLFGFNISFGHAQNRYDTPNTQSQNTYGISNGWYNATVEYSNYSTGTNATYSLKVKVESNNVVAIDFGNGGSIHNGFNSEGYIWSGGYLTFDKDYNGAITAAKASVSTSDNNGMRYYKIRIE